jgi:5-methylcytosine-specific restriction enzyme A
MKTWPSYAEKQRRRLTIAAHVMAHGFVCPGYRRSPHTATRLQASHVIPRFNGGEHGPLRVECGDCNNARRFGGGRSESS